MKKLVTFIFAVSILNFSAFKVVAQGRGQGHGPGVGVPQSHGSSDHAPSKAPSDHHGEDVKNSGKQAPKDQAVADRINHNPELNARIATLLPSSMDLKTAAMGFKNQGQFIAALHVSKNLDIPFDQLKAKMTGTNPESLGKAIHELRPTITEKQAEVEEQKAEDQAKATQKNIGKPTS